jgi:hypothetical protein
MAFPTTRRSLPGDNFITPAFSTVVTAAGFKDKDGKSSASLSRTFMWTVCSGALCRDPVNNDVDAAASLDEGTDDDEDLVMWQLISLQQKRK